MNRLKVQILIDNPTSWVVPYGIELAEKIKSKGHLVSLIHNHEEVSKGDILCLLSCERIFKQLELNSHNLVVHESDLPKGKGWSPLTWQILEGKQKIPVTLFEAAKEVDSGNIYLKEEMVFDGTELLSEMKHLQGEITNKLILKFIDLYPNITSEPQKGSTSFYPKRSPKDSCLDVSKPIKEQFDLLRVCDNDRYPAYFIHRGQKYIVKIYKGNDT